MLQMVLVLKGLIMRVSRSIGYCSQTHVMDAAYYHHERIHQSLGGIIEPMHKIYNSGEIAYVERLGGLLKSYHRLAA